MALERGRTVFLTFTGLWFLWPRAWDCGAIQADGVSVPGEPPSGRNMAPDLGSSGSEWGVPASVLGSSGTSIWATETEDRWSHSAVGHRAHRASLVNASVT